MAGDKPHVNGNGHNGIGHQKQMRDSPALMTSSNHAGVDRFLGAVAKNGFTVTNRSIYHSRKNGLIRLAEVFFEGEFDSFSNTDLTRTTLAVFSIEPANETLVKLAANEGISVLYESFGGQPELGPAILN